MIIIPNTQSLIPNLIALFILFALPYTIISAIETICEQRERERHT